MEELTSERGSPMNNDWSLQAVAREWTRDPDDRERQAAWILLSYLGSRITPAVVGSNRPDGLDSERLLALGWSSTEEQLARAAVSLFHGGEVRLGHLARFGSDEQIARLFRAIRVFRGDEEPPTWDIERNRMID